MSKLFIGMPVYNGERFLSTAIESIRNQTFDDWTLLISDNASTDKTEDICKHYCNLDKRIKYVKQKNNIGAPANFKFLLDNASSKYFMWAAADDVWLPEFLISCLAILENENTYGMAFCNIVNIDALGRTIREYPDFSRFTTKSRLVNISRFLFDPEILGKANLIYSVYRLDLCKRAYRINPVTLYWGSDICFVLAALSRSKLAINSRILFQKRIVGTADKMRELSKIYTRNLHRHIFPITHAREYICGTLKSTKATKFYWLTMMIMFLRVPNALFNGIASAIRKLFKKGIIKSLVKK